MYGIVNFNKEKIFDTSLNNEGNIMNYSFQSITYTIVYSGHIYNFIELKKLLIRKDFEIETNKDEEILIKLYIVFGKEIINHLNGAYSFVIWNEKKKELFAARDRFGLEPFYYVMKNGNFIFGSSIKEILEKSNIDPEVDENRNRRAIRSRTCTFSGKNTI